MTEADARGERDVARDILMSKLEGLFKRYGVRSERLAASPSAKTRAQKALAFAMRERGDDRPAILVEHDASALGWLFDHASGPDVTCVMCTWDKLHPYVRYREEAEWDVLNPAALGDVLSLAAPGSGEVTIASPIVVALALSAEGERLGAAIWDELVGIEKGRLQDARLREAARAFKEVWVQVAAKDRRSRSLQDAWEGWKARHLGPDSDRSAGAK